VGGPNAPEVERFLRGDPEVVGLVIRIASAEIARGRYWTLRGEWPDLVQEVLARVTESLRRGRFQPGRSLGAYVRGVARFTAFDALQRRRTTPASDTLEPNAVSTAPEGVIDAIAVRHLARVAWEVASEPCRLLLRAHFIEGRSCAEISQRTGMPIGTVKSRLFRCLRAIRRSLGLAVDVGDPTPRSGSGDPIGGTKSGGPTK
jgi:RNA polymerase sigma-70 factor (ECF subfamily)